MRKTISKTIRERVLNLYRGACCYCGQTPERLHIDHMVPVAQGGESIEVNLVPACPSCNNYKMSFSLEQFREELSRQVERGRTSSLNFRLAERFGLIQVIEKPITFYFERTERMLPKQLIKV